MRPRINKDFKGVSFDDLDAWLFTKSCFCINVRYGSKKLVYEYLMLHRQLCKQPKEIKITISKQTKDIIDIHIDDIIFTDIYNFKKYIEI